MNNMLNNNHEAAHLQDDNTTLSQAMESFTRNHLRFKGYYAQTFGNPPTCLKIYRLQSRAVHSLPMLIIYTHSSAPMPFTIVVDQLSKRTSITRSQPQFLHLLKRLWPQANSILLYHQHAPLHSIW